MQISPTKTYNPQPTTTEKMHQETKRPQPSRNSEKDYDSDNKQEEIKRY